MQRTQLLRQRGVATLMAVLFMMFILGTVLVIGHQMATTDIYDSNAQNQAVEAIFLAETGLERASRRYLDNSALCATNGLVEGPLAVTVGSNRQFRIVSSSGNTTTCTIRARGEVGNIQRTVQSVINLSGVGGGGGVVRDPGFNNPSYWDTPALVSGGALIFTSTSDDEQKASIPNGLAAISPNPGVVANTVSFGYQITGTVSFRVRINRSSGGNITLNYTGASALTGSGTVTVAIGSFNPNTITEIEIEIIGNSVGSGESLRLDNLYVGPTSGVGGSSTATIQGWSEVIP